MRTDLPHKLNVSLRLPRPLHDELASPLAVTTPCVNVEVRRACTLAGIERLMLMLRDRLDEVTPTLPPAGHETRQKGRRSRAARQF
jgi:hypothetical protein